jgi:hypothetical protein
MPRDSGSLADVATNRGIQTSSLVVGVVVGFLLYAIFRHLFYILIGVAIGALAVAYLRRR